MTATLHNLLLRFCIRQLQRSATVSVATITYALPAVLRPPASLHKVMRAGTAMQAGCDHIIITQSPSFQLSPYTYDALRQLLAPTHAPTPQKTTKHNNTNTNATTNIFDQMPAEIPACTYAPSCTETPVHYYGYRYYSPELGRWISRDPIGEYGALNILKHEWFNMFLSQGHRGLTLTINFTSLSTQKPTELQKQNKRVTSNE